MATIEELLSANLPVVPSLPFRTAQPTTKPEIQAARAELEPYQRAGESGRQQSQMIAEALRTRQRQIGEQAASAREKGLLEIEAKRPIPKELPAFDAPKKTFDELFSVIMVGAMTAAGAGKGNYLAAANSMIGAMEGYQKGKKTEFDQALREFDTSLKKALQEEKVNNARYQQIAASDKLSLAEKVRQIQIQATALDDKIMSATARSNDFEKMTREIARRNEGFAKIEDARNRAEESLKNQMEMRRFGAELTAATRQPQKPEYFRDEKTGKIYAVTGTTVQEVQMPEGVAGLTPLKGKGTEGRPLPAGEVSKLEGLDSLANELEQLKKDFKPEYASLGILGFGADLSLEARRRLGEKEGEKAVSWWSRYERSQAPNRHALFGATLTGNELKNYLSFTAKKSDDPNIVKTFLDDQLNYVQSQSKNKRSAFETTGYKVPTITTRSWGDTFEVRRFNSVEEAERANLPPGTRVNINGRNAVVE